MRPRRPAGLVVALCVGVAAPGAARAEGWVVNAEGGAELDSNVQRVETGPGLPTSTVSTGVLRFGARVEHRGKIGGGASAVMVSDLTRVVSDSTVDVENVTVLTATGRWLRVLPDRPVAIGASATAIDALPLSDAVGARTFRNLGADAVLVLRDTDERALTLGFGVRDFIYKPDDEFDWRGPAANARLDLVLWQAPSKTKSLELVGTVGFEARTFDSIALANGCAPDAPTDPRCTAPTDLPRRDRYQRIGVELTWVGRQLAAIGYQLVLIDSNSFGQSLARHRINASGTVKLGGDVYATLLAILQADQYLDGLVVRRDLQSQEFTNIEDENRSSLQLRLAKALTKEWSLEGRAAIWRNLAGNAMELDFRRELVYAGLVYAK